MSEAVIVLPRKDDLPASDRDWDQVMHLRRTSVYWPLGIVTVAGVILALVASVQPSMVFGIQIVTVAVSALWAERRVEQLPTQPVLQVQRYTSPTTIRIGAYDSNNNAYAVQDFPRSQETDAAAYSTSLQQAISETIDR